MILSCNKKEAFLYLEKNMISRPLLNMAGDDVQFSSNLLFVFLIMDLL